MNKRRTSLGNVPALDDEEIIEPLPQRLADTLWNNYGIKFDASLREKVQKLWLLYRIPTEEISELLNLPVGRIQETIKQIEAEFEALGRPISQDEKNILKGQMISQLLALQAEIERTYQLIGDSKLLTALSNINQQLIRLRGVDEGQSDVEMSESEQALENFQQKLNKLSGNQVAQVNAAIEAIRNKYGVKA